ncbi:MAG TPA: aminoacetone oxidase family FAD-binding enzyme [Kiritimatiellia bacterium]|nr:aminoacetone oxidase family FAD-binding enzyme [Kiritimatiellia bacterium]HPS07714.1 aminoacetone oxidase family FAD-binding enzyme [Kiritimatiellia bacterium]
MSVNTLIIGGGPAGLTAACFCAGPTLVIDRLRAPARKLLATGGGRCNLTHDTDAAGIMAAFGRQSRFMGPALHAFPPEALRAFFRDMGVETGVEPDGCVFPVSQKAADVAVALERAVRANGAAIRCGVRATRLVLEPDRDGPSGPPRVVAVDTTEGRVYAGHVILAAGGQSYPSLGSDGSGFALAREAGLAITPPVPALAGLITREAWPRALAGIVQEQGGMRLDVKGAPKQFLTGSVLFTHKGLSGPPALDLSGEIAARLLELRPPASDLCPPSSDLCPPAIPIRVSFNTARTTADWLALFEGWRGRHGGRALHNLLSGELPRALAAALCGVAGVHDLAVARARKEALLALAEACADLRLNVTGTEGWERAMATRGGVALRELDPKTLACRNIRGLYCAGEVVDLDGRCGGFNLTWAFASGRQAGLATNLQQD